MDDGGKRTVPAWTAPVIVVVAILSLALIGKKHDRAVENPLVDLIIITVGVFAFAALFRVFAFKLNNPGMASFFGASTPSATTTIY